MGERVCPEADFPCLRCAHACDGICSAETRARLARKVKLEKMPYFSMLNEASYQGAAKWRASMDEYHTWTVDEHARAARERWAEWAHGLAGEMEGTKSAIEWQIAREAPSWVGGRQGRSTRGGGGRERGAGRGGAGRGGAPGLITSPGGLQPSRPQSRDIRRVQGKMGP